MSNETNDLLSWTDTEINTTEDCDLVAGCRSESEKRKSCSHILLSFFKNVMETLFIEMISQYSFIYL